ncbi:MAG: NTP transferase domain-containing protein, partial [Pseudomonadales bacterium]
MPFEEKQTVAALLLAGGRSERLGGIDKGLLRWHGIALAEHVLRRIVPQVGNLALSCNRNRAQYSRILEKYAPRQRNTLLPALLEDNALPQFAGPLAGIFSMLQLFENNGLQRDNFRYNYLFVCCCDTPQLPPDLVDKLLQGMRLGGYDAVYPLVDQNHLRLTLLLGIKA